MPNIQAPREFSAYPTNRVFGIVDDAAQADAVVAEFRQMGLGHDLWVLSGAAATNALDSSGSSSGFWGWVTRGIQKLSHESGQIEHYEQAALDGAWVIAPHIVEDAERKRAVTDVFIRHGGREVRYFKPLTIENLHETPSAL